MGTNIHSYASIGQEDASEEGDNDVLLIPTAIQVVAPADLNEGYKLDVDVEGQYCQVKVPSGGVQRGQYFVANSLRKISNPDQIPMGAWRDGIFDCGSHGCSHPSCCLSYFCPGIALGQVLTRTGMDACGNHLYEEDKKTWWSAFRVIVVITVSVIVFDRLLYMVVLDRLPELTSDSSSSINEPQDISILAAWKVVLRWVHHLIMVGYFLYIYALTVRTRSKLRQRYSIPTQSGLSDCCVSLWCRYCAVAQMLRHTANYNTHEASYCSSDGLSDANIV